jgi:hypothetical protein
MRFTSSGGRRGGTLKPLAFGCAVLLITGMASCGGVGQRAELAEPYTPYWCYPNGIPEPLPPPCPTREELTDCYLDAEERAAIAQGAPDLRPDWCFDAGRRGPKMGVPAR